LDTSYSSATVFPDEITPRSVPEVLAQPLITTPLWPLETANTLRSGVLRKRFTPEQAMEFGRAFALFEVDIIANNQVNPVEMFARTVRFDTTAGDAAFLWLAISTQSALATCDQKLIAIANRFGIKVFS
jgi:predicted nucleic acid-binding protein